MSLISSTSKIITASEAVLTGEGVLRGLLIATDGINNPTITVYDGVDTNGEVIIPAVTYYAALLGLNGATGLNIHVSTGIYVAITLAAGSVKVVVEYVDDNSSQKLRYE